MVQLILNKVKLNMSFWS